jgi:hypothetical protein
MLFNSIKGECDYLCKSSCLKNSDSIYSCLDACGCQNVTPTNDHLTKCI